MCGSAGWSQVPVASEGLEPLSTGLHSDICFVIFIVAVMSSFDKYKTLK